jgi:Fe-Mn family superoxide dismutase
MHTLPNLPYSYDALEPYISSETLQFHHDKHHAAYVNKLNEILTLYEDAAQMDVAQLLQNLDIVPESVRQAVINNAGQHYNHSLYWETMAPASQSRPSLELAEAIEKKFGSMESFQEQFTQAGITQFGSGWAWLSVDQNGELVLDKTLNADTPLMHGKTPIMTMDVWEHAYYIDYRNKRPDYISAFWNVVNWEGVSQKYAEIKQNLNA